MLKSFFKFFIRKLLWLADNPKRLACFGEPIFWFMGFRKPVNSTPAKIAIIKLDRLGDIVLCSPQLATLRRIWPNCWITLFVRISLVDLARLCPDVNEVIGVPVNEGSMIFNPETGHYTDWQNQLAIWLAYCYRSGIWKTRFDTALILRWDTDYYGAVPFAYLVGASRRWGVTESATSEKLALNKGFDHLLNGIVKKQSGRHEVMFNETLIQAIGVPQNDKPKLVSWLRSSDQKYAAVLMSAAGVDLSKKIILVCMGAGSSHRMWPVESYARLFEKVFAFEAIQLVTLGTVAEKGLGTRLRNQLGNVVVNLEGEIPLNLLTTAVSFGALYIGSDTGTKHLVAAAGLPVFEVSCHPLDGDPFWAESPLRFGSWEVPNRVVQPKKATFPCLKNCSSHIPHCILGVSHEDSVEALRSLLKQVGMNDICV